MVFPPRYKLAEHILLNSPYNLLAIHLAGFFRQSLELIEADEQPLQGLSVKGANSLVNTVIYKKIDAISFSAGGGKLPQNFSVMLGWCDGSRTLQRARNESSSPLTSAKSDSSTYVNGVLILSGIFPVRHLQEINCCLFKLYLKNDILRS